MPLLRKFPYILRPHPTQFVGRIHVKNWAPSSVQLARPKNDEINLEGRSAIDAEDDDAIRQAI